MHRLAGAKVHQRSWYATEARDGRRAHLMLWEDLGSRSLRVSQGP